MFHSRDGSRGHEIPVRTDCDASDVLGKPIGTIERFALWAGLALPTSQVQAVAKGELPTVRIKSNEEPVYGEQMPPVGQTPDSRRIVPGV